jgi:pyrimidine/purine-5'-nucleotide nucleosidase
VEKISTRITPDVTLDVLSQWEVARLAQSSRTDLYETFRRCVLAVLNTGSESDSTQEVLDANPSFSVSIIQQERGIKLEIHDAPSNAFVDGKMITGIKEHVFAVLRDLVYIHNELNANCSLDLTQQDDITNAVFHILRNAGVFKHNTQCNLVVCWGGHSIGETEYQYTKEVGYHMGLRGLDICTGCGPGAMKGPMKGAAIAHTKQRQEGRYIGITEPGIIAAESPNPIVNNLIIMPDIEKRLEAFVRTGHGIVVFPGGAGTAEEILYILGILLNPQNADIPFPLIFTGPKSAEGYFAQIDDFIVRTLGKTAQARYRIIIDDPVAVSRALRESLQAVQAYRREKQDAYYFNWLLAIDEDFQHPFKPTHASMATLNLTHNQPVHKLAANLRKAFSGIVDGNVKADGIRAVQEHGPYDISGAPDIIEPLDALLKSFVAQKRMKIPTSEYVPCYRIIK